MRVWWPGCNIGGEEGTTKEAQLLRDTKAITKGCWWNQVPIAPPHKGESKCYFYPHLLFYQVHGNACIACGCLPLLQLGVHSLKVSQPLAKVLTQVLSLVRLKVLK